MIFKFLRRQFSLYFIYLTTSNNTKRAKVSEGGQVSLDTVIVLYIIKPKYYQVLA